MNERRLKISCLVEFELNSQCPLLRWSLWIRYGDARQAGIAHKNKRTPGKAGMYVRRRDVRQRLRSCLESP